MVTLYTEEEIRLWDLEKLQRKRDQEWEMAGLARQDGDAAAEKAHTANARLISREITMVLS